MLSNTFSSLKHRDYMLFFIGQCLSLMGTWTQRTAQVWLVYTVTNSPMLLGLLGVCQFGPIMIFSLFAGVFVDRFPKKKILYFTQIVFMLQALVMTIFTLSKVINYPEILILAAVLGFVQTIDTPARQSYIIDLVGKKDLANGISLNSAMVNLAKIIGPMFAGILLSKTGTGFCFLLNTISFIAVLCGLFFIKAKGDPSEINERKNIISEIKEGLYYIRSNKLLKSAMIIFGIVCTFSFNNDVILPVYSRDVLFKGSSGYSILLSFSAIGSFCAALYVASIINRKVKLKHIFISAVILCFVQILTFITPKNLYITAFYTLLMGFIAIYFLNSANSLIQLNSQSEFRGRVMSIYSLLLMGTTPIGNFYVGCIMEYLGGKYGFFICGITTAIFIVISILFHHSKNPV